MDQQAAAGLSTEQFIKGLTGSSLSQFSDEVKAYTPPSELGYENQPLVQPMPMQPQYQQPQQPQYVSPSPSVSDDNTFDDNKLLMEAHETTKESARREQILKEHYLKAEQRASHREKELLTKDLQLAEFFLKNAIDEGDSETQAKMHSTISEVQGKLTKHDIEYDNFINNYQTILDDKPKVFDYAPTYQEEETAYQESPARQIFRKANTWYDFQTPTYNPNLVQKANEIEQKMINEYQLKNMSNYIESPAYFEDLNARMFREFGIEAPGPQSTQTMQPGSDWQSFQNGQNNQMAQPNAPQNYFVPNQVPQFQNGQNPYPTMPVNQPPQTAGVYPQFPQGQTQPYQYGPQAAPIAPQYGPTVAPVRHGMVPQSYDTNEAMFSQKAYDIFQSSLNSTLAPQLANLSPDQKMQLFNAAIKNKGKA